MFLDDYRTWLKKTKNKHLEHVADGLKKWSKMEDSKQCIELFLMFHIAEVQFTTDSGASKTITCTSSTPFIQKFAAAKLAGKKVNVSFRLPGIHSRSKKSIRTWDLRKNGYSTVNLDGIKILDFEELSPENADVLVEYVTQLLKR